MYCHVKYKILACIGAKDVFEASLTNELSAQQRWRIGGDKGARWDTLYKKMTKVYFFIFITVLLLHLQRS